MTPPDGGRADDQARIVDDPDAVVINDRRRLDPETGGVRPPASWGPGLRGGGPASDGGGPSGGEDSSAPPSPAAEASSDDAVTDALAELTSDLQRVSAEYANYRKRTERDRLAVVEMATAGLLSGLLPVLDDVERARQHGDVHGAFKGVADALEALTAKLGLERFGAVGEPFDPLVHEALMQAEPDPTASVATCAAVLQPGYRLASSGSSTGRVLRPARVSVAEPGATVAAGAPAPAGSPAPDPAHDPAHE